MNKEIISTSRAPAVIGPYSQAIKAGGMLYVSGQVGMNPESKVMAEGVEDQTRQVLENLKGIVETSGSSLSDVVKCTVLLADMSFFAQVNAIYAEYFPVEPPARATFAVKGLPLGALVEIECIAISH